MPEETRTSSKDESSFPFDHAVYPDSPDYEKLEQLMEELYDKYGKPLESTNYGDYIAVYLDGRTIVRPTLESLENDADSLYGPGHFDFRIGEVVVGTML